MSIPLVTESARSGKVTLSWMDHRDPELFAEIMQAVERVAVHGRLHPRPGGPDFEAAFAAYCETEHAIGVSSGTEALVLVLRSLGIGAGATRRSCRPTRSSLRPRR